MRTDLADQALALDDRQVGESRGARRRVARVRVAVAQDERRVGLERGRAPSAPTNTPPSGW